MSTIARLSMTTETLNGIAYVWIAVGNAAVVLGLHDIATASNTSSSCSSSSSSAASSGAAGNEDPPAQLSAALALDGSLCPVTAALTHPALVYLGKMQYGIYLTHMTLSQNINQMLNAGWAPDAASWRVAAGFGANFIKLYAATWVFHVVLEVAVPSALDQCAARVSAAFGIVPAAAGTQPERIAP